MSKNNLLLKKLVLILLIGLNVPIKADFNFPDLYKSAKELFQKNKPVQVGVLTGLGIFGYKVVTSALEFLVPVKNVQNPKVKSIGKGLQKLIFAGSIAAGIYFYFKFIKKDVNNTQPKVNPDVPKTQDKESVKVDGGSKEEKKSEPAVVKKQDTIKTEKTDEQLAKELQDQEERGLEERRRLIESDEEYARKLHEKELDEAVEQQESKEQPSSEEPVVIKPEEKPVVEEKKKKECRICADAKEKKDFHVMSCCKQEICKACLNDNINVAVNSKDLNLLKCPLCQVEIDEKDARAAVNGDMDKLNKFNELKLNKFLNTNMHTKHCPTPGCDAPFINEPDEDGHFSKARITCDKCQKSYCANCLEDHTYEETCEEVKERKKQKEQDNLTPEERERIRKEEAETFKIARPCPRCKVVINKDEGCKHMTCPLDNRGCGLHFCWDCLEYTPITKENPNGGYPHTQGTGFYRCPNPKYPEVVEEDGQREGGRNREEERQAGFFEWREGVFHRRQQRNVL